MSELGVGAGLAGYRIESLIGRGSVGTVYSAKDLALDRRVAVKVLAPTLARDERFRERFLRESRLVASLEHPNIVPIYAAGEADGLLYLAMRYVDGRDLASLLSNLGRLDAERAIELVAQVGNALDAAHGRGLIHRDVKPGNILLAHHDGRADHAYLCDFGLAKHASTVSSLTGDRGIVGTVEYLAPEQIEGGPVDGRVDVYALGCVLYELLTGEPPFSRGNELGALLAHINDPSPKVSERRPELPEALDDVIAMALAKDRDLRYATCGALVTAARAALRGERGTPGSAAAQEAGAVRTFLFADVRGYTAYTREHGDEAGAALAQAFAGVVSQLAPQYRGMLQELRGDEALVVFDSARAALRFALALQEGIEESGLARPVGIGLDAGEAVAVVDGFRGGALNRAARLCALAGPREVLASDAVRELAGTTDGVAYGFRRVERLKGFQKPVGVVEIHSAQAAPGRELRRRVVRTLVGGRSRRRVAASALVLLAALVALAVALVATRHGSSGPAALPTESLGIVDTATGKVAGSMNPGSTEVDLLIKAGGGFWALSGSNGFFLQQLDATRRAVTQQVPLANTPYAVLPHTAFGSIWLTWNAEEKPELVRFDTQFGRISARIALPVTSDDAGPSSAQAQGIAATAGGVWVAYGVPKKVSRIDPRTNKIVKTVTLPAGDLWGDTLLAAGDGQLWAIDRDGRRLVRLDPKTGAVLAQGRIHNGFVEDAAVAGGSLWLPVENDGGVWQVDRSASIVGKVDTGQVPWALAVDGRDVYVSNQNSGTVTRIDALTRQTRQYAVGHRPLALGVESGRLWVFVGQSAEEARARITGSHVVDAVTPGDPFFLTDPATLRGYAQHALQYAVGVRLMDVKVAANGTTTLYPSGAVGLPSLSHGGRSLTFVVRPGFRYSPPSGAAVTAADWKFSIERALSPVYRSPQSNYCQQIIGDIAGQRAYEARRAAHISGIVVSGPRITFTLTKPSPTFLARLANACFTSVPLGTPAIVDGVAQPIASAGPYYVDSHIGGQQLILRRNPNYTGPRKRLVDAIVFRNGFDPGRAASLVAAGSADYTFPNGDSDTAPSMTQGGLYAHTLGVGAGNARRYFQPASSGTRSLILNTRHGPLRDVRLRQAIALALDRSSVAQVDGAVTATRMIPPGVPGYAARQKPLVGGPRRARALIGNRRIHLALYTFEGGGGGANVERARLVRASLAAVGIQVSVHVVGDPWTFAARNPSRVDILFDGWAPDYLDASDMLNELLDPKLLAGGLYPPFFTDPRWLARLRAAASTTGTGRAAAYARLDRALAEGPTPAVPVVYIAGTPQLFSKRVGCHTFLPQYSGLVDFAALCLKS
jgi:ABC-type transport system substrate-binding protein/class 3 adenylate cyclase/tRNA A-37 threonylcarbamoyl transferase component Bud32